MADIITNVKTVLVRMTSAAQDARSVTLDNPRDNITLAQIRQAFAPMLNMRLLLGNKGDTLDAVESATVTTSQKVKLGESDIEITITPNSFEIPRNSTNFTNRFTIEGAKAVSGYFTNVDIGPNIDSYNIELLTNNTVIQVTVNLPRNASEAETAQGDFNIITTAGTVAIPLAFAS